MKKINHNSLDPYLILNPTDLDNYIISLKSDRESMLISLLPQINNDNIKIKVAPRERLIDMIEISIFDRLKLGFYYKLIEINKKRSWIRIPKKERVIIAKSFISSFIKSKTKSLNYQMEKGIIFMELKGNLIKTYNIKMKDEN